VFFDGRSDFYGDDLVKSYVRMMRMKPGWRKEFDGWRFTHALLAADHPLAAMLEAQGWREIYRDKTAVLLAGGVRKD
jgi:hypothetical protein